MNWTSDYGVQRVCPKVLCASGVKGLEPIYYSVVFCSILHPDLPVPWLALSALTGL